MSDRCLLWSWSSFPRQLKILQVNGTLVAATNKMGSIGTPEGETLKDRGALCVSRETWRPLLHGKAEREVRRGGCLGLQDAGGSLWASARSRRPVLFKKRCLPRGRGASRQGPSARWLGEDVPYLGRDVRPWSHSREPDVQSGSRGCTEVTRTPQPRGEVVHKGLALSAHTPRFLHARLCASSGPLLQAAGAGGPCLTLSLSPVAHAPPRTRVKWNGSTHSPLLHSC